jgi:hypothetical protein
MFVMERYCVFFEVRTESNFIKCHPPKVNNKIKNSDQMQLTVLHFLSLYLLLFRTSYLLLNLPLSEGRAVTAWEPS